MHNGEMRLALLRWGCNFMGWTSFINTLVGAYVTSRFGEATDFWGSLETLTASLPLLAVGGGDCDEDICMGTEVKAVLTLGALFDLGRLLGSFPASFEVSTP